MAKRTSAVPCTLFIYDISRCGLYLPKTKSPKHLSTGSLLKEMKKWAIDTDKPIIETSTYTGNHRYQETFCLDLVEGQGQYLLALWNKVSQSKSGIGLINGSKSASDATMSHAPVSKNDIPGFPTFFWFLPSSNKVVAIRLDNPALGIGQLREYIKGYLNHFCSYTVSNTVDDEEFHGFADFPKPNTGEDNRVINSKLFSSFSISASEVPGKQNEFLMRYDEVTKLVKDVHVYNNLQDSTAGILEKVSSIFNDLPAAKKKKIRIQMPVSLKEEEMKELINLYNENDGSEEYDVGFVFKGASAHIDWLSGSQQRLEESINVQWKSPGHPNLKKLLKSLQSYSHLLATRSEEQADAKAV